MSRCAWCQVDPGDVIPMPNGAVIFPGPLSPLVHKILDFAAWIDRLQRERRARIDQARRSTGG
jgi:hypothetical protein